MHCHDVHFDHAPDARWFGGDSASILGACRCNGVGSSNRSQEFSMAEAKCPQTTDSGDVSGASFAFSDPDSLPVGDARRLWYRPCGAGKQLETAYRCVDANRPPKEEHTFLRCTGQPPSQIRCPAGKKIRLGYASFGRRSATTCPQGALHVRVYMFYIIIFKLAN